MELREWLIKAIAASSSEPIVAAAMGKFAVSRQTVNRELSRMVAEGIVGATGETRGRQYHLRILGSVDLDLPITPDLREDAVWRQKIAPLLEGVRRNVLMICQHGFTEILNNAIDHSDSPIVKIHALRTAAKISMTILDLGVGIFKKIQREKNLDDAQEAIFELSKGKLTTDPDKHTGEGIFFTSRMFDQFGIMSDHYALFCTPEEGDWFYDLGDLHIEVKTIPDTVRGTCVMMQISCFSERTFAEVMNRFAGEEQDYSFSKTHVPVRLARYDNAELISRSQAKRLMARMNRFKEVVLDFAGIETIGQGFADEIFRVYRREHPAIHITYFHASPTVQAMIRRADTGACAEAGVESRADLETGYLPGMEPKEQQKDGEKTAATNLPPFES